MRGDEVALVLEDDGRGIDGWRLAQKAVARGQLSPEAADALDEAGRLELMFLDGLSTAEQATDVSGRGVGMSAVRAEVERLGGRLEIRTVVGEGTAFSIVLPRYGLTADLVVGAAGGVVPRRDEARAPGA